MSQTDIPSALPEAPETTRGERKGGPSLRLSGCSDDQGMFAEPIWIVPPLFSPPYHILKAVPSLITQGDQRFFSSNAPGLPATSTGLPENLNQAMPFVDCAKPIFWRPAGPVESRPTYHIR